MNPNLLFEVANTLALISWIVLIIFQRKSWVNTLLMSTSVSMLAITYMILVFSTFEVGSLESFGSLQGVMDMFGDPWAVAAGWVHYLCFDLMIGLYIVTDARKQGINQWVTVPSLLFTFMLGPFGLLTYLIIRIFNKPQIPTY